MAEWCCIEETKMRIRDIVFGIIVIAVAAMAARGQNNANIIGSVAGSTLANCGTPTTPAICVVAAGVYVWQSAAAGWTLIGTSAPAPPPPSGVTSITINGTTKTGAASFSLSTTPTVTIAAQ